MIGLIGSQMLVYVAYTRQDMQSFKNTYAFGGRGTRQYSIFVLGTRNCKHYSFKLHEKDASVRRRYTQYFWCEAGNLVNRIFDYLKNALTSGLLKTIKAQMPIGNPARKQQDAIGSMAMTDAARAKPSFWPFIILMPPKITIGASSSETPPTA